MIKWWKHRESSALNLALHMMFINARGGYKLAANVEAQEIERLTGVPAWQAVQMAREVIMIQDGVAT